MNEEFIMDIVEHTKADEQINDNICNIVGCDRTNNEKLYTDIADKYKGGGTIAVVDRVITDEDGNELFEYVGMNATTIGGTQTIVENTFANLPLDEMMPLVTVDGSTFDNPTWQIQTNPANTENWIPRKIFGFMLADDGANGSTVRVTDRRSQSFDLNHIVPFLNRDVRSDNKTDYLGIGTAGEVTGLTPEAVNDRNLIRESIGGIGSLGHGKYALRVSIGADRTAYLAKLLKFEVDNIKVNGAKLLSNTDTTLANLDVRTRVRMIIDIREDELGNSLAYSEEKINNIKGTSISSVLLVAGRPTVIDGVHTYHDVIVTNRVNFVEVPVVRASKFRYTIYYV